ncbi:uncharacterized protein LOC122936402 isoform X3 [Bufo gargarizans]|uniref:uncharacterized protein LOC122921997 isoform X2 n=1 Tax=Bufo gargarizans TaxID=30331 RepID=UPI001CF55F8E|nr:uncharacterized protein LOC122921997 isoform X2 [Bufo gargarizans]XP_044134311.1 uncharacterized protein LOC122926870 isoform X3 [Bufo gargarizans]XP_044148538.1 uncharacterized protein LOC122936402 isoform X3 [Bufo gargarizans]
MSERPLSVEEMLEWLRREAEVRGPGWLQEQVGACVIAPASAATPTVRAVRPRRGVPPARLSPDCTPRVRRRVGSPSRDPPRRRGSAQPSAGRSRRGRNPGTRRGPERSGTPLPPLSPASPEDAGPGTVDRPSPGPSGRSTQRGEEIHVRRVAQSEQEELCRPSAGAGAAAEDRRPVSIIQRAVRDVREESPSTSRRSAEVEDVRRESGSAAAGITAPVVPVGPVPASCSRSGVGGSGVSVVAVGDLGGEVMGLLRDSLSPGFPVALVWILGHSYVFWGAIRADVRPNGRQLGLSSAVATVRWLGVRGMLWGGVLREVQRFSRLDRPPDVLVLHVGGNDLGRRPFRELVRDVKFDLLRIWALFPGVVTVWSDIVPRKSWREARSVESINKARIKVNRAVGRFMARNGAVAVRHEELEKGVGAFWRADGVHLNAVGTDLWSLGIQNGVEIALRMWRDAQA